ncbi:hypothetical protein WAI453_009627 [Rhynchosporium graminicola]
MRTKRQYEFHSEPLSEREGPKTRGIWLLIAKLLHIPEMTCIRASVLEKSGGALLIVDNAATTHSMAKSAVREDVYAGTGSGGYSLHVFLSPADCKEAILKKAAIEIRMWLEDQAQAHQHFNHVRSVVINAEVMAAPLIRIRIPSPGPLAVIKALEVIIPKVSTWFGIVSDVLKTWQSTIHGVECLVIQIEEIYALDSN